MKVFTTGQVAKICKVAPRTVSKWFDSGRLKGYRIPGSQDRRIPREYLIKFLKEHGMPLGDLEDEAMAKVLIVAQDQVLIENLKRELPLENGRSRSPWPPAASTPAFKPKASIPIASSSISRSGESKRCRSARISGTSRVRRDDSDRPAARRRQLDELRPFEHQRDVQEAVRRQSAGRAPADADRREERTGLDSHLDVGGRRYRSFRRSLDRYDGLLYLRRDGRTNRPAGTPGIPALASCPRDLSSTCGSARVPGAIPSDGRGWSAAVSRIVSTPWAVSRAARSRRCAARGPHAARRSPSRQRCVPSP